MNKNGVIAFCGSKAAGKSTSAEIFKEIFNQPIEDLAIAGRLKEVSSEVFNIDMKYFLDPALKEVELDTYVHFTQEKVNELYKMFGVDVSDRQDFVRSHVGQVFDTPRRLLQYVGSELLHPIDPQIHVKNMCRFKASDKLTVVTDLRFLNEFNYLKETYQENFLPVYIKNSQAEEAAMADNHPSERGLFQFRDQCRLVSNDSSLVDLKGRLQDLVKEVFGEIS